MSIHHIDLILQEIDIEGLVESGAPRDEYISEAEAINSSIQRLQLSEMTIENIELVVSTIWKESFNLDVGGLKLRKTAINTLAKRILNDTEEGGMETHR